jgi:hypothetical protein
MVGGFAGVVDRDRSSGDPRDEIDLDERTHSKTGVKSILDIGLRRGRWSPRDDE